MSREFSVRLAGQGFARNFIGRRVPLTSIDLRNTTPDNPVYGLAKPTQVVDHCRVGWVAGLRGIDGDIDDDAVFAERIWDLAKEAAAVTD